MSGRRSAVRLPSDVPVASLAVRAQARPPRGTAASSVLDGNSAGIPTGAGRSGSEELDCFGQDLCDRPGRGATDQVTAMTFDRGRHFRGDDGFPCLHESFFRMIVVNSLPESLPAVRMARSPAWRSGIRVAGWQWHDNNACSLILDIYGQPNDRRGSRMGVVKDARGIVCGRNTEVRGGKGLTAFPPGREAGCRPFRQPGERAACRGRGTGRPATCRGRWRHAGPVPARP